MELQESTVPTRDSALQISQCFGFLLCVCVCFCFEGTHFNLGLKENHKANHSSGIAPDLGRSRAAGRHVGAAGRDLGVCPAKNNILGKTTSWVPAKKTDVSAVLSKPVAALIEKALDGARGCLFMQAKLMFSLDLYFDLSKAEGSFQFVQATFCCRELCLFSV